MEKQDEWMKKRMEDIPKPVVIGKFEMTDEEKIKAKKNLEQIIKMAVGDKEN